MKNNLVSLRAPSDREDARRKVESKRSRAGISERSHVIITVGGERFAIDFTGVLSEINPVETEILSIDRGKLSPKRKGSARPSDK